MPTPATPVYLDWTFWAAVWALVAIILSQFPPVHLLLRPKRLDVEVHSRIFNLDVWRDGKPLTVLPAQNYFETLSSQSSVLFVPFSLKPGETQPVTAGRHAAR